jgi:hypothetical protein
MLRLDVGRHQDAEPLRALGQHASHGVVEPGDLVVGEGAAPPERGEAGLPQDLVAVGVADARDEPAVAQQRLQLSGVTPDPLGGTSRVSSGSSASGPISAQPGMASSPSGSRGRACRASRGRRSGARGRPRGESQAGPRTHALVRAVIQKRPASIGLAARSGWVRPSRSNGRSRNLPRRGGVRSSLRPGSRARPGWRERGSASASRPRHRATGDPPLELLGHDREVGQLRHAVRFPFDPMVCYAGRVADNPIVVRERASNPSGAARSTDRPLRDTGSTPEQRRVMDALRAEGVFAATDIDRQERIDT